MVCWLSACWNARSDSAVASRSGMAVGVGVGGAWPNGVGDGEEHGESEQEIGEQPTSEDEHVSPGAPLALVRLHRHDSGGGHQAHGTAPPAS